MKLNKFALSILTVAVAIASQANAATNLPAATNQITLTDLVNEALVDNPELNFYRAEIAAAHAGRRSAGAWANPEISANIGSKRIESSSGSAVGEGTAWSVSAQQSFEFPGRLSLRKAIANRDIALAETGLAHFKLTLAARVRTLGHQIFISQEKLSAANEVAERFQALTEVLVQRDPAGLTPALESHIIEANAITLQRQASRATIAAQSALLELNQLRGKPPEERVHITAAQLDFSAAPSLPDLLAAARTNSFELRTRQLELEQQGFKVSLAKNERFPSVSVGPFISEENAGDRERIIGLGVSLPLPLWNRNSGNIQAAQAREQQAQTSLLVMQRDIERRVTENAIALKVQREEMSKWQPDTLENFHKAAELADRHYRLGAVPITTYVELQKQYLEAVEAMLETKQDALNAAQKLEQLTGVTTLVNTTRQAVK